MLNKIKIKISQMAYEEMLTLLKENKEYSALRFEENRGCCREPKLNLLLDNRLPEDLEDKVDNLSILYNVSLPEKLKEVIILYKNNRFLIKTVPLHFETKNCGNCSTHRNSKNKKSGCNGCNNPSM